MHTMCSFNNHKLAIGLIHWCEPKQFAALSRPILSIYLQGLFQPTVLMESHSTVNPVKCDSYFKFHTCGERMKVHDSVCSVGKNCQS